MKYLNIAGYKFVYLPKAELPLLQEQLKENALAYSLKGTILLSTEGVNICLSGASESLRLFIDDLRKIPAFSDLWLKESESDHIPFKRLRVRIKAEIIAMQQPEIQPDIKTAPYLEPEQLKTWYDEKNDVVILDTRNTYEIAEGTFDQAIHLDIEHFNDFPKAVQTLPKEFKTKTIVTFCTGGIRCEKAAAYLIEQGFKDVWQLKGGILHYFEQCGSAHFQGNCFVFDERIAVDSNLKEVRPSA